MSDADWVAARFTRADGTFRFARWGRPLAPVIVGTDDAGCRTFEAAVTAVAGIAGVGVGEIDAETGANFLVYIVNDWTELETAPNLVRLIPNLGELVAALVARGANQYRIFGFDEAGAIRLCISLLRYDEELQRVSAQTLAVGQAVQGMLLWSDAAFGAESPLAMTEDGTCVVKPAYADLMRAAYDPVLPAVADDPSFALRLAARLSPDDREAEPARTPHRCP